VHPSSRRSARAAARVGWEVLGRLRFRRSHRLKNPTPPLRGLTHEAHQKHLKTRQFRSKYAKLSHKRSTYKRMSCNNPVTYRNTFQDFLRQPANLPAYRPSSAER
jgi:hypothetical protein